MILGFSRGGRYEDVLLMFKAMEAMTAKQTVDGVWLKRQKGYWACFNEAMKACEVCVRSMCHTLQCALVLVCGSCANTYQGGVGGRGGILVSIKLYILCFSICLCFNLRLLVSKYIFTRLLREYVQRVNV